jgi:hypothetical protein
MNSMKAISHFVAGQSIALALYFLTLNVSNGATDYPFSDDGHVMKANPTTNYGSHSKVQVKDSADTSFNRIVFTEVDPENRTSG